MAFQWVEIVQESRADEFQNLCPACRQQEGFAKENIVHSAAKCQGAKKEQASTSNKGMCQRCYWGRITVMIWEVETSYYSGVISLSGEAFSLSTIRSSTWLEWLNIEMGTCCEGEQECVSFLELILIQKFTPALSKLSSVRRPQCDVIWFALNLHHFGARSTQRHDFLQVFAIQVDKRHWNSLKQIHNLIQG